MANNLVEYLASLKKNDPKRANWIMDCPDVGTNDWGFGKVKVSKELIAGSRFRYDFKSAYSTNPTISPVLSRAKVSVTAWFIPTRLYVPALRDGVEVKAGKTDYAFPTINFNYPAIRSAWDTTGSATDGKRFGAGLPYIPANSIFSELGMWKPYFQPIGFAGQTSESAPFPYPEAKNAIPLLGYYDIFRNFIFNSQSPSAPIRVTGFSKRLIVDPSLRDNPLEIATYATQNPSDLYVTRENLDNLFKSVRADGASYPMGEGTYDVSSHFKRFFGNPSLSFTPQKKVAHLRNADGTIDNDNVVAFNDNHYGEWRQTYFADYYTAYLSNENVEYERSTARVQTDDDGYITMEQIYSAQKVQNYIRSTIFKNSDYAEFIDSQYGVTPSTSITKPMFLGSMSTWLTFNDVIAQAQSGSNSEIESNQDLGSRASLGFGRMVTGSMRGKKDRPFVDVTVKEPGYFMVIETIVPEVAYWQGFNPMYDKRTLESLYYPAFDRDGYQDKQLKYLVEQPGEFAGLPPGFRFDTYNVAYAQEPAWWEYMTTFPKMSGQMVDNGVYRHWVFNRTIEIPLREPSQSLPANSAPNTMVFNSSVNNSPFGATLDIYVKPEDFNHIFANINGLDNIQTYYRHEFKLYQPLSHRFLSF